MINSDKFKPVLYTIFAIYVVTLGAGLCITVPRLSWDPSLTLKMTDNAYKGIPFNHYAHPSPSNLTDTENEFVTWWTPGQYALPMLIQKLFAVKLLIALKILTGVCLLIAGLGFFKLYKKLIDGNAQASANTWAAFSFTLFQPLFFGSIIEYDGGGILMLAYCPWFIYGLTKIEKLNPINLVLLLVGAFAGFFLKASFTCFFAAGLLYVFLSQVVLPFTSFKNIDLKKVFKTGLLLGLIFVAYFIATKVFFLNYNRNIADSAGALRLQPRVLVYPIVAPFIALFSLDSLTTTFKWLIACVFVLPVYYLVFKSRAINLKNKYLLGSFVVVVTAFFGLLYLLNIDVSYEPRHFVTLSILLVPALYKAFVTTRARYVVIGLMVLYAAFSFYGGIKSTMSTLNTSGSMGYSGIHLPYPADVLSKVHELDKANPAGNDIFYFKNDNPIVALEVRNNRVLLEDNFLNFHFDNDGRFSPVLYHGYNQGQIYVVYPTASFKADSVKYLTRFEKYRTFQNIYQSTGYAIFKAIPAIK